MCKNMLVYFYVLTNGAYRSLCRIMSEKIKGLKSNVHDLNKLLKNRYIQYIQLMEEIIMNTLTSQQEEYNKLVASKDFKNKNHNLF